MVGEHRAVLVLLLGRVQRRERALERMGVGGVRVLEGGEGLGSQVGWWRWCCRLGQHRKLGWVEQKVCMTADKARSWVVKSRLGQGPWRWAVGRRAGGGCRNRAEGAGQTRRCNGGISSTVAAGGRKGRNGF